MVIGKKRTPPRVVLAQRVVRNMAKGAALYPDEETAEALVGLIIHNESGVPDFYVLDTIAPEQSAIEREGYMVEQGDEYQEDVMYWYAINWKIFREQRQGSYGNARAGKWNAPLRYLGDWHKQPGTMFWPSQGDLETAKSIVHDEANDMPDLIAPIVTIAPEWDDDQDPPGDEFDVYAVQQDGPTIRINFWYLNRDMREFIAARPEVLADDLLPRMPSMSWHLTNYIRFEQEHNQLTADGLAVSVVEWDADNIPPLEVCFMVGRMGSKEVIILVTQKDYPETPPTVRTAPMIEVEEGEDMFEKLWAESSPYDVPNFVWTPDLMLLDLVRAVEESLP